jgi:hypothetical protein
MRPNHSGDAVFNSSNNRIMGSNPACGVNTWPRLRVLPSVGSGFAMHQFIDVYK